MYKTYSMHDQTKCLLATINLCLQITLRKKPLPAWHPLLTGQKETTHGSGVSVRGSTISEKSVNEDDWENYIITDPK